MSDYFTPHGRFTSKQPMLAPYGVLRVVHCWAHETVFGERSLRHILPIESSKEAVAALGEKLGLLIDVLQTGEIVMSDIDPQFDADGLMIDGIMFPADDLVWVLNCAQMQIKYPGVTKDELARYGA